MDSPTATTTTTTTTTVDADALSPSNHDDSPQKKRPLQTDSKQTKKRSANIILAKNAAKMVELAEKALVAVQEMMALEAATREEAGMDPGDTVFCGEERALEDAEHAIGSARYYAEKALKEEEEVNVVEEEVLEEEEGAEEKEAKKMKKVETAATPTTTTTTTTVTTENLEEEEEKK